MLKLFLLYTIDVTASAQTTTMSVSEEDGILEVCAVISAMENTERNFALTLAANDGTGTDIAV